MAGRGKVPAIMLYTGDWIKDPELSMCSPATRGIWIDWLCRLQEMCSSGRDPILRGSLSGLARAGRCSESEAISALRELGETGTAFVTMSHDVTVGHSEITVPIEVENRRLSREYRARLGAAERQRKSRENRKLLEAGHENVTTPLSSSSSISVSTSPSSRGGEGNGPPSPPPGKGLKNPDPEEIEIPPSLAQVGLTLDLLRDRMESMPGEPKPAASWKAELTMLAELVPTFGVFVIDVYRLAISTPWRTITPKIVMERAKDRFDLVEVGGATPVEWRAP